MVNLNGSIDQFIVESKLLINNSINDAVIKQTVNLFGYNGVRLTNAQNLLVETEKLHQVQIKEYGDQYHVQDAFNKKRKQAHEDYMDMLTIARVALKNNVGAQQSLGLNEARKKSYSGWLEQALSFCNNMMSNIDYIKVMMEFGQTEEKLEVIKKGVTDTQKLAEEYNIEKGEAQQATEERDAKIDELNQWVSDYKKIVRIALKENPQSLEKLGLLERS